MRSAELVREAVASGREEDGLFYARRAVLPEGESIDYAVMEKPAKQRPS